MKKTIKYLVAVLAFVSAAFAGSITGYAQNLPDGTYQETRGIAYAKRAIHNEDGTYTIDLETFVTGEVTIKNESIPADIVLVLDVSSSMEQSRYGTYDTRLDALRASVLTFIEIIDKNDLYEDWDQETPSQRRKDADGNDTRLGNRIAIIPFGGSLNSSGDLAPLGLTLLSSKATLTSKVNALTSTINGTNPAVGLNLAKTYLSAAVTAENAGTRVVSTKTVVLFTDGCPASSGPTNFNAQYAYNAVNHAYDIKTDETYGKATVYTIGLFTDLGSNETQVTNYMNYASSNYPTARASSYSNSSVTYSTGEGTYDGDYFQMAGDDDLDSIFTSIAQASGGSAVDLPSTSIVTVDVVTASFSVPHGGGDDVTVLVAPCEGKTTINGKEYLAFGEAKTPAEYDLPAITPDIDEETNTVTATGFDFSANWCGYNAETKKYQGYKQIIRFVITVNEEAVGGPDVATNASSSGIYVDGNQIATFNRPTVKIPVSIWIQKNGLLDDDNAVFTIYSSPFEGFNKENIEGNAWTAFTKVVVGVKDIDSETGIALVKITGLDPDYYYRIKEDEWAWGYTYQSGGILYTVGDEVHNPFVFTNIPKDDVPKHAEAIVRNTFSVKPSSSGTTE